MGRVEKERSLLIAIPAGIESGKSLRLPQQGEFDQREGKNGDLFVDVTVKPHPVLRHDGYDLKCEISIGFATAALGGEARVPTLTDLVLLNIPRGTQSNQVLRLRGQGLPRSNDRRGDILVTIVIDVPKNLTHKQEKLLREYAKSEEFEF